MSADGGAVARPVLSIRLSGRLSLRSSDGHDLTPASAKAQGLIALLATSPDRQRSRRWLQDKLWSDRGRDQGAASLRQTLMEIRRALGVHVDLLRADRQAVAFNTAMVSVQDQKAAGEGEFLEGIDVRDPEFETWLCLERSRRSPAEPVAPEVPGPMGVIRPERGRPTVFMCCMHPPMDALGLLESLFSDALARTLNETLGLPVLTQVPTRPAGRTIRIDIQGFLTDDRRKGVRVRAQDMATSEIYATGVSLSEGRGPYLSEDLGLVRLASETVQAIADALTLRPRDGTNADAITIQRLAVRKLFMMDPQRLVEADALLMLADEMDPRGLTLAWRAQLRAFQAIEQHARNPGALAEEADDLCRRALERDPSNSMVLAVASYARGAIPVTAGRRVGRSFSALNSVELARRSVALNPTNPVAWDSLSIANLDIGDFAKAHEISARVQRIGASSPNKFWWDMGLCVTAALTGRTDLAIRMARLSAAGAPGFHAPLRYLTALLAATNNPEGAIAAGNRLREIEPGFSFDAMANDRAYPVGALRRVGLLRSDRIRDLGP